MSLPTPNVVLVLGDTSAVTTDPNTLPEIVGFGPRGPKGDKGDTGAGAYDASSTVKGIIKLTGDLGGIADSPTVPALANKQPLDSDLTAIAGLSPSNDDMMQRKAGAWTNRTPAQVKADLALSKSDVGLGNVDNTSDATKPVSTATQAALDSKEPTITAGTSGQYWRGDKTWQTLDKTAVALGNVTNDVQLKAADLDVDGTLAANSDTKVPSQKAVKTYADTKQPALGYTAENAANKSTSTSLGTSSTLYPTQGAVKTYVDAETTRATAAEATKAPLASPALTGTPTAPTATSGTNTTQLATTAFVEGEITANATPDATTGTKGKVQLAGDLAGTAASPTVLSRVARKTVGPAGSASDYVCTGTADDVKFQSAISAVSAAGGGVVFLRNGSYSLSAKVTLPSNVHVVGEDEYQVQITLANSVNATIFENSDQTNGNTNIWLQNLTINGNGANQTAGSSYGIHLKSSNNCLIDRVHITSTNGHGILLDGASSGNLNSQYNVVRDSSANSAIGSTVNGIGLVYSDRCAVLRCKTWSNGNNGLYGSVCTRLAIKECDVTGSTTSQGILMQGVNDSVFEDNRSYGNLVGMILRNQSNHNYVFKNRFTNNTSYNFMCGDNTDSTSSINEFNVISSNVVEYGGDDALVVEFSPHTSVVNNIVRYNGQHAGDQGIPIDNSPYSLVQGNIAEYNFADGIEVKHSSNYTRVIGNICRNNGNVGNGNAAALLNATGIVVRGVNTNVSIIGNSCFADEATPSQTYGILLTDAGCDYCTVVGNTLFGNSVAQISEAGGIATTSHNIIEDNPGYAGAKTVDQPLAMSNSTTSNGLSVTQTGNVGSSRTKGAIYVDNTGNLGNGLSIYSPGASTGYVGALFNIRAGDLVSNTTFDFNPALALLTNVTTQSGMMIEQTNSLGASRAALVIESQVDQTTSNSYGLFAVRQTTAGSTQRGVWIDSQGTGESAKINATGGGKNLILSQSGNNLALDVPRTLTNKAGSSGAVNITNSQVVNDGTTYAKSGTTVAIVSSVTQTSGTITDTGKVVTVTQSNTTASGNVLDLTNSGTGADLVVNTNQLVLKAGKLALGAGTTAPGAVLDLGAATTSAASLRIRSGTAPTSPNDGDVWYDGSHLKMNISGTSYQIDPSRTKINVRDYGAKGDGRRCQYVAITSGTANVTCTQANFTSADVGKRVVLFQDYPNVSAGNTGLVVNTTILSVTDSSHAVLNANAAFTLAGNSVSFMIIGTDDSAAIQSALNAAKLTVPSSLATDPNVAFGAGYVDVVFPADTAATQGLYVVASQISVPTSVMIDCPTMLVNVSQSNGTTPFIIFNAYSGARRLLIENCYNSGMQAGTNNSNLTQCYFDDVQIWHTGMNASQCAITLVGYDHQFRRIWLKNANVGVYHNGGSDFNCDFLFAIGCSTAVYMNATQQANYGMIFMDTCSGSSPYGGICLDNQCANISIKAHAFEDTGTSFSTTPVVSIGQVTASSINRDIVIDVQADNTGGHVLDIAYAKDTLVNFLASNTATVYGSTNPITTGVVYGSGVDASVVVKGVLSTGITPYTGTLSGSLDYVQGGVRNLATEVTVPTPVNPTDAANKQYVDSKGTNLNSALTAGQSSGITVSLTSAETQAIGDVVQINASGQAHLAKADVIGDASGVLIAATAVTGSASNSYLLNGLIRLSSSPGWTVGGLVYLSVTGTTGNTLTQTPPAGTNTVTQVLGVATAVDTFFFNPSLVQVEHT